MKTSTTSIRSLQVNGFVNIAYPPALRAGVLKAAASWEKFCALPKEVKLGLPYSNGGAGVGYELKEGIGKNADRKENFDLTIEAKDWLIANAEKIKSPEALSFIQDATALTDLMQPTIMEVARQIEEEFGANWGLVGFADEVVASKPKYFPRFICYDAKDCKSGDEIASAHVDQSGMTLHLFESTPGLQCLMPHSRLSPPDWTDMPVSDGETAIIGDMQLQLISQGQIKATPHRVIATEKTAGPKGVKRLACVCFIQFVNKPKYDKEKHGRLQEKPPGFNYVMEHEEFVKLFKE